MSKKEQVCSNEKYKNIILILAAVAVTLAAFIFAPKGVEYSGTDDAAEKNH